jgi:hypothetical protein
MRTILVTLLALATAGTAALAQIPAGPGQQPGTLPPAPPIQQLPPPTPPPPVPSVVTPLRSPSSGGSAGVIRPSTSYGSIATGTYRAKPKPRHKKKRRPRTSEILLIRTI